MGDKIEFQAPQAGHDVRGLYIRPDYHKYATITVATWNVNSLDRLKVPFVTMLMKQDHIDIMILTDTRHTNKTARSYKRVIAEILGPGTRVFCSDDDKRKPGTPGMPRKPGNPRKPGRSHYKIHNDRPWRYAFRSLNILVLWT